MVINFANPEKIEAFKGGEKHILMELGYQDEDFRILRITIVPGASIGEHIHDLNCEIMYFISGTGVCYSNGEGARITPGMAHYCRNMETHCIVNDGTEDLVLFAVVPQKLA